ncbi:MAG: TonB family protein [Saprospiraceae bacterium]|jgi:TonB family protein
MKEYYLIPIFLFLATVCSAQIESGNNSSQDTTKTIRRPPPPPPPPPAPEVEEIFRVVENPPRFLSSECEKYSTKREIAACADRAFTKFIYDQLKYPEEAFKKRIQGKVFVEFMVDKNGNVKDPKIVSDIGGGCGEEVIRIINICPKWKPRRPRGRTVPIKVQTVVHFDRKAWKRKLNEQAKNKRDNQD